ncbi:MAG TPA: ATP-binding cassette domain-containing protein, partial [Gemmatimonadales bacterium]|nr:ATP-binding cassette domain-containing protein [Gemmatimonadales bacterium]
MVVDSLLSLSEITKHFGAVRALSGVDFSLEQGEVHALLGENGAGKSTLLQVAYGMTAPDAGRIRVRGREVRLGSPRGARGLGIGMVHQHFTSIGELTVRENIELATGGQAGWGVGVSWLAEGLEPEAKVGDLPVALRQRLEIVKALAAGAEILLLDEPSAVLAPAETEELLARIREFVREGGAAALVTHKLGEVFAAADRVTVLRQGAVIMRGKVAEQTPDGLAAAMIGPGPDGPGERKG